MQMQVSDRIPYGNVAAVEIINTNDGNLIRFAAAAHGGIERMWFCFRLSNPSPETSVGMTILELKHVSSMLGNPGEAREIRPVIRYEQGGWERLPEGEVRMRPDGHLSILWRIATPSTFADLALCYPYGEPEIERLVEDGAGYWRKDEIGVSQNGHPIIRLSNSYGEPDGSRPGVFITARQHAAEVSGSWVLDGFLRRLAEFGPEAPLVWCVPLTNIDGVMTGDYGKNPYPHDLNRAWDPRAPMRHETKLFMIDQTRWRQRCRAMLFLDFHSPGMAEKDFYCFASRTASETFPLYRSLVTQLRLGLTDYAAPEYIRYADYKPFDVWGQHQNATEHAEKDLQIPGLSFESSYQQAHGRVLSVGDYRTAGGVMAEAVVSALRNY